MAVLFWYNHNTWEQGEIWREKVKTNRPSWHMSLQPLIWRRKGFSVYVFSAYVVYSCFNALMFIFSFNLPTVLRGWHYYPHVAKEKTEFQKMKSFFPGQSWMEPRPADSGPRAHDPLPWPLCWGTGRMDTNLTRAALWIRHLQKCTNPRENYFLEKRFSIEFL